MVGVVGIVHRGQRGLGRRREGGGERIGGLAGGEGGGGVVCRRQLLDGENDAAGGFGVQEVGGVDALLLSLRAVLTARASPVAAQMTLDAALARLGSGCALPLVARIRIGKNNSLGASLKADRIHF